MFQVSFSAGSNNSVASLQPPYASRYCEIATLELKNRLLHRSPSTGRMLYRPDRGFAVRNPAIPPKARFARSGPSLRMAISMTEAASKLALYFSASSSASDARVANHMLREIHPIWVG